jgi:hypothetical protein
VSGYEVVLQDGDGDEIRLTDQPFVVGETVELDGRMWLVASAQPAGSQFSERRFVLKPAGAGGEA